MSELKKSCESTPLNLKDFNLWESERTKNRIFVKNFIFIDILDELYFFNLRSLLCVNE